MDEKESVAELVRRTEKDYRNGETTISKYVTFNQSDNIEKIDAYLNSKHISGETDSKGREKPFANIVVSSRNAWFRSTDLDRKNIKLKATSTKNRIATFLANIHLQEWMKKINFGTFLNKWGLTLATYGSAVVKFVEKDGELHSNVISWNRIICDTVDFANNPKIEKFYLTPSQLRKNKSYDQDVVKELIESTVARKTLSGQTKDQKSDYIEVYEVHGELPLSMITDNEDDDDIFVQQMHIVSFTGKKDGRSRLSKYDDFTLYKGKESKDPYMITHLIEEDGRTQSIGAVEYLFEAQWMYNHTAKQIKDQLDLASKLIFQTSDPAFVGKNALSNIDTGDILIHELNQPLTHLANNSQDIGSLQNFGQQWKVLASEITGVSESMLGSTPPSGTAWRQTQALLQESHDLFEQMIENKGLQLEDMVRKFIIPYVKKQMDSDEEVMATLEAYDIKQIDSMYIKAESIKRRNDEIKKQILEGAVATPQEMIQYEQLVAEELNQFGNQRPIGTEEVSWKKEFKDVSWDAIEVEITNEQRDLNAILSTLSTVMQVLATNPGALNDPNVSRVFKAIMEATGTMSSIELSQATPPTLPSQPQPMNPATPDGGMVGAGQNLPANNLVTA